MELAGDGYLLRPWRKGDEDALIRHGNDRDVWRNMTDAFPHPYTAEDAEEWLETVAKQGEPAHNFAIVVGGEPVGGAGFQPCSFHHKRTAEIGYWIGQAHWGRGLATKALERLTSYAFANFDIVRLEAHVFEWNPASARVLAKAGYHLEARHLKRVFKDGQLVDEECYVRLRDDVATSGG